MPDSNRPSLFTRPDQPPPRLRGHPRLAEKAAATAEQCPRLDSPLPLQLYDAGVFIRKNARPGAKWVQEAAKKAEPVVRAGAKIGKGVRNVGTRMTAAAGAFRDPEGKNLGRERQVRRAGDTTQKYGERITAGSEVAGAVLSLVQTLAGVFKSPEPISIDPRREGEEPSENAGEAPEPDGRFLPRQPDKRPSARAAGGTAPVSNPPQAGADPDSGGDVQETQAELPHESPASEEATRAPPQPPEQTTAPDRAEVTPPDLPEEEPNPAEAEEDPARTSTAEALEPEPETRPERQPPPPAPPAPAEDRFEGVPKELLPQVTSLKERTRPEHLHPVILDICLAREWTTAKQLARWFSMHRPGLVQRHLGPLVDQERLILRFPDKVRSRNQAYRTNRDKWPPRR